MRTHGTLTKWNDDRGFGFITRAKDAPDLFVHISAFPEDGARPRLNELISFETEAGPDGRQRAVRVMRPGQRPLGRHAAVRERRGLKDRWLSCLFMLLVITGLGAYGYFQYTKRVAPANDPTSSVSVLPASAPSGYSCDGRTTCSQMTSCAEAKFFIRYCPNTQMDGDSDGVPCESQLCN